MDNADKQWKSIYLIGGISTIVVLCGIIIDMVVGTITGGDISTLPQTAIGRFSQLKDTPLLGLYNLDLLNTINQLIMIPAVFALYAAHRKHYNAQALLALILFVVGTTIFVTGNTALTMLDLSHKYFATTNSMQQSLLAAAGETMLAKGAHGSLSVFIGFALPVFAYLLLSWVMIKGKVFSKATSYIGLLGAMLMLSYIILVTFIPEVGSLAMAFAMPGGLLSMAWMILFTVKLFKLSFNTAK